MHIRNHRILECRLLSPARSKDERLGEPVRRLFTGVIMFPSTIRALSFNLG